MEEIKLSPGDILGEDEDADQSLLYARRNGETLYLNTLRVIEELYWLCQGCVVLAVGELRRNCHDFMRAKDFFMDNISKKAHAKMYSCDRFQYLAHRTAKIPALYWNSFYRACLRIEPSDVSFYNTLCQDVTLVATQSTTRTLDMNRSEERPPPPLTRSENSHTSPVEDARVSSITTTSSSSSSVSDIERSDISAVATETSEVGIWKSENLVGVFASLSGRKPKIGPLTNQHQVSEVGCCDKMMCDFYNSVGLLLLNRLGPMLEEEEVIRYGSILEIHKQIFLGTSYFAGHLAEVAESLYNDAIKKKLVLQTSCVNAFALTFSVKDLLSYHSRVMKLTEIESELKSILNCVPEITQFIAYSILSIKDLFECCNIFDLTKSRKEEIGEYLRAPDLEGIWTDLLDIEAKLNRLTRQYTIATTRYHKYEFAHDFNDTNSIVATKTATLERQKVSKLQSNVLSLLGKQLDDIEGGDLVFKHLSSWWMETIDVNW